MSPVVKPAAPIALFDKDPNFLKIDLGVRDIGRQQDRRRPEQLTGCDLELGGMTAAFVAQGQAGKQQMRRGRTDIDPDTVERQNLQPFQIAGPGIKILMVMIEIGFMHGVISH